MRSLFLVLALSLALSSSVFAKSTHHSKRVAKSKVAKSHKGKVHAKQHVKKSSRVVKKSH